MTAVDEADVQYRLAKLANELADSGELRSAEWRRVFLAVRRHVFVPRYWHDEEPGAFPARWRMVDKATRDHEEWLGAVYSNRTLATDLTGTPTTTGRGMHPQVTSSTTMPGLVLAMLEDLDVADGMRVLEIGTGAGYSAALLCERLGDTNVTSIDIDPELVALASIRLAEHGYRPHLVTGNGAAGVAERSPFDRIIATCGVDRIPRTWIEQTRGSGKIMANIRGPFTAYALILLTVNDGTASGMFLRQSGSFMPLRTDPARPFNYTVTIYHDATNAAHGHSWLDPRQAYDDQTWGLLAQTHLNGVTCRQIYVDGDEHLGTELASPDGSCWAVVHHTPDDNGHPTRQAGPRRLWDELEQLYQQWTALGRPVYHRFGLTLDRNSQTLWLDDPDSGHTWNCEQPISAATPL
ncbi:MAG: methyltransferase domain-containing protein [Pseudonocardiaceae bacterium]